MNLAFDLVDRHLLDGRGGRIAVVAPEGQLTWRELAVQAHRGAYVTRGLGVVPGDRVLVALGPGLPRLVSFLGCARAGAVAVCIEPGSAWPSSAAAPGLVLGLVELRDWIPPEERRTEHPQLREVLASIGRREVDLHERLRRARDPVPAVECAADDPVLALPAVDDSGGARCATWGHGIVDLLGKAASAAGIGPHDRVWIDPALVGTGFWGAVLATLHAGATLVLGGAGAGDAITLVAALPGAAAPDDAAPSARRIELPDDPCRLFGGVEMQGWLGPAG